MAPRPGIVALFGSGETSSHGRKVYDWVFSRLASPPRLSVLETPAGFQPNSSLVAGKIADFLRDRLQNFHPEVTLVPARRRGGNLSPDDPRLVAPLLRSNALFLGPGSPTYAVRHLRGTLAWDYLQARHRLGAAILLASAATIAAGNLVLPVYEIYKVGEDLHWHAGLDLLQPFGLTVVFVPHWDNSEGGAELDTSRCFMGQARFEQLLELLPPTVTVAGIDEQTALVIEPSAGTWQVMGRGGVTIRRSGQETRHGRGPSFPLDELGPFRLPEAQEGISLGAWESALASLEEQDSSAGPPQEVLSQVQLREEARSVRDWQAADALRLRIEEMGWRVKDTPEGPLLELINSP